MNTHDGYKKLTLDNTLVLLAGGGHKPLSDFALSGDYVYRAGDTMTGILHMLANQYEDTANTGALDLSNSDIYGVNSIKFADLSDVPGEGLQWYRDATHVDTFWVKSGVMYFTPNRAWGATGISYTVLHTGNIGLYVGGSGNITANTAQTNGSVYLTLRAGASYFKHNIIGATGISVTSDANGKITITGTEYSTTSHTHAFAQITNKITNSNEFNFLDSEYALIWFNYRTANDSAATTAISTYHFGSALSDGSYASVKSAGFVKNGSDDTYILLGGGGHTLLSGLASTHTHPYLPLAGGAMNDLAVITRTGESVSWVNGRKYPLIKTTSYTGYNSILSMKTTNGSWDLGVYTNDIVYLTYITDTNYNNLINTTTYQILFPKKSGTIALTSDLSGYLTSQDHYKTSPGAGTAGTSSATSGSTLAVPYLNINANGHITGYGTHTHTITGFLPGVWTSNYGGTGGEQYTFGEEGLRIQQIQDESSGIQLNGDFINMWAPCDSYCIRFWDEDSGSEMWNIDDNCVFSGYIDWTHVLNASLISSDTWRAIKVNGTLQLGTGTNTGAVNFAAGTNVTLSYSSGTITINSSASSSDTWRAIKVNGTQQLGTGTGTGAINFAAGSNVTLSYSSGTLTINSSYSDNNTWRNIYVNGSSWKGTGTGTGYMDITAGDNITLSTSGNVLTISASGGGTSGDYLPLAGGTMTGAGSIIFNNFETSSKRWFYGGTRNAGWKYDYGGNEALIISAGSFSSAAISFYSGGRLTLNDSSGQWSGTTADMQIKQNCVGIGANVNTSYKLYVAGSVAASSGFVHTSVASDDYVLLAGGGYTALSNLGGGGGGSLYYLTLNGTNKGDTSGTSLGSFYAPTSAGTSGQYLKSNGSGAPTWATFDFASSGHSHTLKIETTSDNSSINLAANTKYKLTAGGSTYVFKTPAAGSASGAYLPLAGGTMTGTIIVSDGNSASSQNDDIAAIRPIADNWHTIGSSNYHFCEGYINTIYSEAVNATSFYGTLYGSATNLRSRGNVTCETSTTRPAVNGLSMSQAYVNGYPYDYGNIITCKGTGDNELLLCWSGTSGAHASAYIRSRRDVNSAAWSDWAEIVTSANYTNYLTTSGGTSVYQYHNQSMSSNTNYRILTSTRTSNGTLENVYSKSACYMNDNGVYFTSDKKMKKDIRMFSLETNIMDCYNPVRRFSWKSNDMPSIGFISQEVEEWCPEAVGISDDGLKTVNYDVALSALCGAMFNRIKELEQTVKELQYQININKR